jgi:hypothetical protein
MPDHAGDNKDIGYKDEELKKVEPSEQLPPIDRFYPQTALFQLLPW